MALTDSGLEKYLNKEGKGFTFADGHSLAAVVSPKGKIIFQYRFRWITKHAKMKLGTYPAFSLNKARKTVLEYKDLLEQGIDPRQHKQLKIEKNQTKLTVKKGLDLWLLKYAKMNRTDHDNIKSAFETYVYPFVGKLSLESTTITHWNRVFENEELAQYPVQAGRILGVLQTSMRYLAKKDKAHCTILNKLKVNDVGKPAGIGERILLDRELALVWKFVSGKEVETIPHPRRMGKRNLLIVKLILAFGGRTAELRKSLKSDFDLVICVWKVTDRKTGNTILRPIHDSLVDDIQELIDMYPDTECLLPPMPKPKSKTPVSGQSIVELPEKICSRLNIDKWNMHDLRRTIITHTRDLGVDFEVAEKLLSHVSVGSMKNYNKYSFLKEQLAAYDVWIGHLDGLG